MNGLKPVLAVASLCLAALAGVPFSGLERAAAQTTDGQAELVEPVEYEGVVQAARTADVSPKFDGLVQTLNFRPGDLVKKGQLLVQMLTQEQEYLLEIDKANLDKAAAELELAEVELQRAQQLRTRDVVAEAQLNEAVAKHDIAAASRDAARTEVEKREYIIREYSLHAPFDGIISAPFANEGAYITTDSREINRIATVTQLDPIHVVTEVPYGIYARRLERLGSEEAAQRLVASLILPDGTEFPHQGRIVSGGFAFDKESQTISSIAEFPNPERLLRPGLRVTIRLMLRPADP